MLGRVVRAGSVGDSCVGQTAFYQGNKDTKPPTPGKERAKAIKGDEGSAFWSVRCTNGKTYQVMVRPDGSGSVLDCAVWALLGGQECFLSRDLAGHSLSGIFPTMIWAFHGVLSCVHQLQMSPSLPFRNVTVARGRAAGGRGAPA
jgi:hypothetical protein